MICILVIGSLKVPCNILHRFETAAASNFWWIKRNKTTIFTVIKPSIVTYWFKKRITRIFNYFRTSYAQTTHASLPSHSVWANWCSYYMAFIIDWEKQHRMVSPRRRQSMLLCKCSTSPPDNGPNVMCEYAMRRYSLAVFHFAGYLHWPENWPNEFATTHNGMSDDKCDFEENCEASANHEIETMIVKQKFSHKTSYK